MQHRVIKNDDLFLTSDTSGDIRPDSAHGLYMSDTRFLSRMELTINGKRPMLLYSAADENVLARIRLTNAHDESEGRVRLWRETIELVRERFIHGGVLYETIRMKNFATKPVAFELGMAFDADFRDMFQVRGFKPADPLGRVTERKAEETRWHAVYMGADGCRRETAVAWDVKADAFTEQGEVTFAIRLAPGEEREIRFTVAPSQDGIRPVVQPLEEALAEVRRINIRWRERCAGAESDCEVLNRVFERGTLDLRTLLTDYGHGPIPVAGIPWFAVPFGRDSLITALLALPLQPEIARVTLRTMAEWQGTADDPWKDEQPGKIMHELRRGELSRLGRVPFAPYYGSIDSTPLFLLLAAEYAHWTGDTETVAELVPAIERALEWIDRYGDRDGDGFVEYLKESDGGLVNQGWKDSGDAIIHKNGEFARAPIALIEVQGYVYQAKTRLADVLARLGRREWANRLRTEADRLRRQVESVFWMPEEDFYAIALDAGKRQVESVTSNPGHLLMSGLPDPERARRVARRLVSEDLFGGYGIRQRLAARQRDHSARHEPSGHERRSADGDVGAAQGGGAFRVRPAAGAVLRLRRFVGAAGAVPGCLLAAGVGGGHVGGACAGDARARTRRAGRRHPARSVPAAGSRPADGPERARRRRPPVGRSMAGVGPRAASDPGAGKPRRLPRRNRRNPAGFIRRIKRFPNRLRI